MQPVLRIALFAILLTSSAGAATYEAVDGSRIVVLDGDKVEDLFSLLRFLFLAEQ